MKKIKYLTKNKLFDQNFGAFPIGTEYCTIDIIITMSEIIKKT